MESASWSRSTRRSEQGPEQRQHLVLLPGLDGTDVFLKPFIRSLPAYVEAVVVSYPDDPVRAVTYDQLIEHVRSVVAALPQCHVLGWSFGGPLALRIAEERPDLVQSVILAATFVRTPNRWMRPLRPFLYGPSIAAVRGLTRLAALFSPGAAAWRADLATTWKLTSSRSMAARLRTVLSVDERRRVGACRRPVLYLGAQGDRLVPPRNARDVVSARASALVYMLPGPHLAMYLNSAGFADAVGQFIWSVAAGVLNTEPEQSV
jgi:pimeloyl-[acyl-carrier protein] methyl ester esterase